MKLNNTVSLSYFLNAFVQNAHPAVYCETTPSKLDFDPALVFLARPGWLLAWFTASFC